MYTDNLPTRIDQCLIVRNVYFYSIDEIRSGLVLTPTCDFAQDKAELVQVCALFPAWEFISELLRTDWSNFDVIDRRQGAFISYSSLSRGKRREISNRIKDVIRQRFPRYHWLAPLPETSDPVICDFQNIASLSIRELETLQLAAELISPFREQVPARYAAYMGRVGTPDFMEKTVQDWIDSGFDRIFPDG